MNICKLIEINISLYIYNYYSSNRYYIVDLSGFHLLLAFSAVGPVLYGLALIQAVFFFNKSASIIGRIVGSIVSF